MNEMSIISEGESDVEATVDTTASSKCADSLVATSLRMPYFANFNSYRIGIPPKYPY